MFNKLVTSNSKQFSKLGCSFASVSSFATYNPNTLSAKNTAKAQNLVNGKWKDAKSTQTIIDPLNGDQFIQVPNTSEAELQEFRDSFLKCPDYGLHNPFLEPQSYAEIGEVAFKAASALTTPEVREFFVKAIQRVCPKSTKQAEYEVDQVTLFLKNISGDGARYINKGWTTAGDRTGQQYQGYRWPFGPTMHVAPFNYPLRIPAIQLFSAVLCGNKVTVNVDSRVSIVIEQFIRLLIQCGLPAKYVDLLHTNEQNVKKFLKENKEIRLLQFNGTKEQAEEYSDIVHGKIRFKTQGVNWKTLTPGVLREIDFIAWQSDDDAYTFGGQKANSQGLLIAHDDWVNEGFFDRIKNYAAKRSFKDLSIVPTLNWSNARLQKHLEAVLKIPGSKLLFGGDFLKTNVPEAYGTMNPTAVFVPLNEFKNHRELLSQEVLAPFQIITQYKTNEYDEIVKTINSFKNHLSAGVISGNPVMLYALCAQSTNGTTYFGKRSRTTGAPANHFFGPCGDPRAGGIGTPEAILGTWTTQREIIRDIGDLPEGWTAPNPE